MKTLASHPREVVFIVVARETRMLEKLLDFDGSFEKRLDREDWVVEYSGRNGSSSLGLVTGSIVVDGTGPGVGRSACWVVSFGLLFLRGE